MAVRMSTNVSSPTINYKEISNFRGVDTTHSKLEVADTRAVDLRNFIMENGNNTKRFGFEEQFQFEDKINGIWHIDISEQKVETYSNVNEDYEYDYITENIVLVQVSNRFYMIKDFLKQVDTEEERIIPVKIEANYNVEVLDQRSEAFVSGNKLFILCGDYLCFSKFNGEYKIKPVIELEDCFVPTMLTKIVCKDSAYITTGAADDSLFESTVALDDRNILSDKVKITLLGEKEEKENVEFIVNLGFEIEEILEIKYQTASGEATLENSKYSLSKTDNSTEFTIKLNNNIIPITEMQDNITVILRYKNKSSQIIRKCTFGRIYGYNGERDRLFVSGNPNYPNYLYHSTESGISNEVDFTYFSDMDYIKLGNTNNKIYGMLVQGDGTMAILKTPSSQEPTIYTIKATLQEATDYMGNKVEGLAGETLYEEIYPVSIGTIGVGLVKRNGLYNLNGDPLMIGDDGIYGIVLGSNVATSQRYAKLRSRLIDNNLNQINNLEDTAGICYKNKLYFCDTQTGLCYIADARYPTQLSDDLSDTYQYEWWIWDNIYARVFFEYDNNLYFGTPTGQICMFKKNNYKDVTYKHMQAGNIGFDLKTNLFKINKYDEIVNSFNLSNYEQLHDKDKLNFSEKLELKALILNETEIYTKNNRIYYEVSKTNEEALERFDLIETILYQAQVDFITKEDYDNPKNNFIVIYLDKIKQSKIFRSLEDVSVNKPYLINDVLKEETDDLLTLSFRIMNLDEALAKNPNYNDHQYNELNLVPTVNPFRISTDVPNDLTIENLQTTEGILYKNSYKGTDGLWYYTDSYGSVIPFGDTPLFNCFMVSALFYDNKVLEIISYNDEPIIDYTVNLPASLTINEQILAYFITPFYNLGNNLQSKTLKRLIIVPDTLRGTKVELAYETRNKTGSFTAYTGRSFDFNDFDFDDVSFSNEDFAKTYSKKCKAKKFNYIRFIFKNQDDNNCKLDNITIAFTYSSINKGER